MPALVSIVVITNKFHPFLPFSHSKIPFGPGFQVPLAEKIKKEASILTATVGYITTPEHADEVPYWNEFAYFEDYS